MPGFQNWLIIDGNRFARISTELGFSDRLGACKARWGIGRMSYIVPPGLYAIGNPNAGAPVLVTANYKMSFDSVRSFMTSRNVWLLVLETFGINVWCAAGKGTFGTDELVHRIAATRLAQVVSHRNLLLPILGAPGVSAHEVLRRSGFKVDYATIRAHDLPEFMDNDHITTPAMRQLTFTFYERLVLIPVELVLALKSIFFAALGCFILFAVTSDSQAGLLALLGWSGACLAGIVAGPLLLPWLPGRSFAVKGAVAGVAWSLLFYQLAGGSSWGMPVIAAVFLALPAVSAFYMLNFTGCTPYTSRSGVKKEMRFAIPAMGGALVVSALLLLVGKVF